MPALLFALDRHESNQTHRNGAVQKLYASLSSTRFPKQNGVPPSARRQLATVPVIRQRITNVSLHDLGKVQTDVCYGIPLSKHLLILSHLEFNLLFVVATATI